MGWDFKPASSGCSLFDLDEKISEYVLFGLLCVKQLLELNSSGVEFAAEASYVIKCFIYPEFYRKMILCELYYRCKKVSSVTSCVIKVEWFALF